MKLSDKIFIHEAIELLEFQKKPIDHVIHSLMNEENIATYFDVNVDATESTGYEMQPINQDGDELPYVNGAPPMPIEGPGKKILEADVVEENKISFYRFEHEGKLYCGADNEGTHPKPIVLAFDEIYFEKSEFHSYQDVPAYQDKNHEYYAPELDLAIQLHQAIHIEKYGNQGQSRLERVSAWLIKDDSNLKISDAQLNRLSSIIKITKDK